MLRSLLLGLALGASADPVGVYNGRGGNLDVRPPRVEAEVQVDGVLDEAAWDGAALLTGFSQFSPADGVPAVDSTEVLIWYSPTAIHFGIRAHEPHGAVHATLADRDRIGADDHIQILLSTFNDGRQATVFAVNPLGVQSDGALVETGSVRGNGFNNAVVRREAADLSPDYVFDSKGRLTDYGYEIEVRIPFQSLRYQSAAEQSWGINVTRRVQHSGYEDSWTPARRASASFLAQSGRLVGLTDLRRGLVLDFTPSLTSRTTGERNGTGAWEYSGGGPEVGGTVRWGISNNLSLNGTANPAFSQVESDTGQLIFDPRDEQFLQEKRPFFLDGIEQFTTPNNLVYTRRVVQPSAAVKLTGKTLGTDLALLSAVDDREVSLGGDERPIYNILRFQRDVGSNSRVGVIYTDRIEGGDYNRVAGADARLLFGGVNTVQLQLAGSRTRRLGATTTGPLWQALFAHNGRMFGIRASINASDEDFRARSGFFPRPGLVHLTFRPRVALYGGEGAVVESFTFDVNVNGRWRYREFVEGDGILDEQLHFNLNTTLRGGWQLTGALLLETFGYPFEIYGRHRVELTRPDGAGTDTVAFVGRPRIPNRDYVLSFQTPEFEHLSGNGFILWGNDENFYEWSPGRIIIANGGMTWRPTDKLRLEGTYAIQQVRRRSDGSLVDVQHIPRVKLEYQLSRPIFLRLVGEYATDRQDDLRDDTRTEAPILVFDPGAGDFVRATGFRRSTFQSDILFSYQPGPGTVLFAGYGNTLLDPDDPFQSGMRRVADGFFFKMSYLFQM
ncbi:MAG: carbohydrate binding family 9 domain-containing protein [Gemmatimonadales bacterium]|nr:carbohydrate binding family 9 domain-containing protein [Gemmatimonadales bacterium]